MENVKIEVYNTHIKIHPYDNEDHYAFEKHFRKYNPTTRQMEPSTMMTIEEDGETVLYLPRGANIKAIEREFNTFATDYTTNKADKEYRLTIKGETPIDVTASPRNRIQEEAIGFLTASDNFKNSSLYNQLGLNLDTGDGKTFCTISAIIKLNLRAIIIVHKDILKKQWKEEFIKVSDIAEEDILDIKGAKEIEEMIETKDYQNHKIFITTHQTLQSLVNRNKEEGWSIVRRFFDWLHVGIKVIDEMHKYFENTIRLDFFSDVYKSFYLTATFGRSDYSEKKLFKQAYSSMLRYGEQTIYYEEKRKHINFIIVYFHSRYTNDMGPSVYGPRGFSSYKYIDYELRETNGEMMRVIEQILERVKNIKGRVLVISPKIDSVKEIAQRIEDMSDKSIGLVHSEQTEEENMLGRKKEIISSTIKSVGEGDNIEGLRIIINTEPIGSDNRMDQLRGRLREYSKEEETYFFHLVDTTVDCSTKFLKRIMSVMRKKCKAILSMRLDV